MSSAYFSNFQKIYYNGRVAINVLQRSQFFAKVMGSFSAFYPFTVQNDISAKEVAAQYYGDQNYEWLVFFSNQILDPYYSWPMPSAEFEEYLVAKYGDIATAQSTIKYYKYNITTDATDPEFDYRVNYRMEPTTYFFLSDADKGFWLPVTCYDDENNINEAHRHIRLIDNDLLPQIDREISTILKT
jgi:hypothetical protein